MFPYQAPRAPDRKTDPQSVEECLNQAHELTEVEGGRIPLGPVEEGEHVLIVTLPDQNDYVERAVMRACEVAGADEVRFMQTEELTGETPTTMSVETGWKEAVLFENGVASGSPETGDLATGLNVADPLKAFLDEHPQYTKVFWDIGARTQKIDVLDEHGEKFHSNWGFNTAEEFLSPAYTYPDTIVEEAERKIVEMLDRVAAVKLTDPEGSHLSFTLTPEEAHRYKRSVWLRHHLFMDPLQATNTGECLAGANGTPDYPPVFSGVDGVLAGTANHNGFYPRIELHFEDGRLVDVEGGGKYGEKIQELHERYSDVHWPGYPEKGFFWFCDAALCTLPKAFRRTSDMFESYWQFPNFSETFRAGIMHMGIGSRRHKVEEHLEYARENDLPLGHIHVHNYFPTFEVKLRDTGNWHKIVEDGRLTVLDSPEIRAIATEYGDPDELLSYDWVPPLPGINCEGDYWEDYAPDPASYLQERIAQGKPL